MSGDKPPESTTNITLAYLASIDRRLGLIESRDKQFANSVHKRISEFERNVAKRDERLEERICALCANVEKQSRYLFIGRIAFATTAIISGVLWWMLEHSTFLSWIYFHFMEKGINHDHIEHSK